MTESSHRQLRNAFFLSLIVYGFGLSIFANGKLAEQEIDASIPVIEEAKAAEPEDGKGEIAASEFFEADVTAYSALDSCHTGPDCLMASGKTAYIGAAACPRNLAFGTKVQIADKTYTCEDRTAERYDGRFDIFMGYTPEDYQTALRWGKQRLLVLIEK